MLDWPKGSDHWKLYGGRPPPTLVAKAVPAQFCGQRLFVTKVELVIVVSAGRLYVAVNVQFLLSVIVTK